FGEAPNGERYELPTEGVRLRWDYAEVQRRHERQKERRKTIAKRIHDQRRRRSTPQSSGAPLSSRSTTPKTPSGFDMEGVQEAANNNYSNGMAATSGAANGIMGRTPSLSVAENNAQEAAQDLERYRREEIEGVFALAELGNAASVGA